MIPPHIKLYNFVDNHDVERIHTKLMNKAHYIPVHILLYTLPGIPSVYYGSEFGIDGRKERGSDDSLRPSIDLEEHLDDYVNNPYTLLIIALGRIHREWKQDLVWGDFRQLCLTNQQYAFARGRLIVAVNNSDGEAWINVEAQAPAYIGLLSGRRIESGGGRLNVNLPGCGGDIFAPDDGALRVETPVKAQAPAKPEKKPEVPGKAAPEKKPESPKAKPAAVMTETKPEEKAQAPRPEDVEIPDIPYDLMTVEQLQAVILKKMAQNGPVTERMRQDVVENIWHNSLVNWANSFR